VFTAADIALPAQPPDYAALGANDTTVRPWLASEVVRYVGEPIAVVVAESRAEASFGAHLAVVEVDTETGAVRLLRMVAVDDCGTVLNPLIAEGQVHGGLAQGIAQALLEEILYDADGNPLTTNLADYAMISSAELPSFETCHTVRPSPLNPLGVKGIGEWNRGLDPGGTKRRHRRSLQSRCPSY
jgi:carbon-monoxide dehydrogenase large subunit